MSNTNTPSMQSEDQEKPQHPESNNEPTNQQAPAQQPPNALAPAPAPPPISSARRIPARRVRAPRTPVPRTQNRRYNFRAAPTQTVFSPIPAGVTKKTTSPKKPVRKPTARVQRKYDTDSDGDVSNDEEVKTITVTQMSEQITNLLANSMDVADSYMTFLAEYTLGNGAEVTRLKRVLGKRMRGGLEKCEREGLRGGRE
jgi:hypothetical protein